MKKILLIMAAILIFSPLNAGIRIAFNSLNIQNFNFKTRFYSDSLFGARGDGLRAGGTVSTLDFTQSFSSYNPACLAFQKGGTASFSGIPFEFVSSDFAGFVINHDFSSDLSKAINDSITAMTNTADVANSGLYVAQANGITGMEGMVPFADNNAAIGISREEKFGLELTVLGEGISSALDISDPSNTAFAMSLTATAGLVAGVNIKSIVTSIGLGRKITPQWGIGAVLEYIDTRISIDASANAHAIGMFTDPLAPPMPSFEYGSNLSNSLEQSLTGELSSAAWALRVGTSYHAPNDAAELAVDFSIQPTFEFGGKMDSVIHTLPTDSVQIQNEFLSGSPTTVSSTSSLSDTKILMKLPSFVRTTLAYKPGPVIAFNYTRYFDSFAIAYSIQGNEGLAALALSDIFRIGINFEYFQIGGGVMLGNLITISEPSTFAIVPLILPIASFGCVIPMGSNVKTEIEFVAFPLPVAKASLTVVY